MIYEINTVYIGKVKVQPRVELYTVRDLLSGQLVPGLAVCLDEIGNPNKPFSIITTSFGELIGLKNAAYIDLNNCPFATEFLRLGVAEDTGFYKRGYYCNYPLWKFKEEFLKEHGAENYQKYSESYEECAQWWSFGDDCTENEEEQGDMVQEEGQAIGGMQQ